VATPLYSKPAGRPIISYGKIQFYLSIILISALWHHAAAQDLEQIRHEKKLQLMGGIDARAIFYNANGIAPRYLPFNYLITGTPVLSVYGVQVPVYFSFSRQQSAVTQPFNQFGLSPTYKNLTIHAGYRNLQYSPFTLAGHTFLGGGADYRPGKWRLGGMYGRFNKATVLDTLQGIYIENFSYKRTGYALKAGYGTEQNFFDLIILHGKDHTGSAPLSEKSFLDSLKITPAENFVNGFHTRLMLIKNKLFFESDGALSLYTTDIRTSPVEDSTIQKKIRFYENFTTINYSTEIYGAFQASLTYRVKAMSLRLQYRYVEPNYKSMGAYFLNNDLENLTINPTFMLGEGKVRFTGSLGLQRDNLQKLKGSTSNRVIGAANISAELNEYLGADLSYTNFSNTQRARTVRFADSLRVAQTTQNLSFSPRYMKSNALHSHSVMLSYNYNQFQEYNAQRALEFSGNDIITQTWFATYQHGFLASRSSLFGTLNYARLGNNLIEDTNSGLTIGGSKILLSNKLMLSASSSYLWSKRNGERGRILNESLQARYGLDAHNTLNFMLIFLGNYPETASELMRKFTELRVEIGYAYNF
jgi:hypothetical protein